MKKIKKHKKKILVGILIVVLLACLGFGGYKYYEHYEDTKFENKNWLNRHISLEKNSEGVYEVQTDEDIDIFNLVYQDVIENKINTLKISDNYSLENPLIIYNPYGTGSLSYYIYFGDSYDDLSYKVSAKGYADYEHSLGKGEEYQIIGFIPGVENTLTLSSEGTQTEVKITTPEINGDIDTKIEKTDGDSTEELADGLYTVLGHDKNYNSNIYLYDNEGILRNELVLEGYRADRIVFDDENMYYSYSKKGIVKVNELGKIENIYDLGNYSMHHDMVLDGDKLVILANEDNTECIEDRVITLDLETGEVTEVLNMNELLPELKDVAVDPGKNSYGSKALDWIHLNSISIKDDDIILSAREVSTIIYISDYLTNPTVKYLLTDESMLEGTSYDDLLYEKSNDFVSQAGQHAVTYIPGENDNEYYLIMFNNNSNYILTKPDFTWENYSGLGTYDEGENSYYYKYKVNEKDKTYELVSKIAVPYSSIVSSVQQYDDNIVVGSGKDNSFGEYDQDGNLINEFKYNAEKYAYRVFKYSFDNWFE